MTRHFAQFQHVDVEASESRDIACSEGEVVQYAHLQETHAPRRTQQPETCAARLAFVNALEFPQISQQHVRAGHTSQKLPAAAIRLARGPSDGNALSGDPEAILRQSADFIFRGTDRNETCNVYVLEVEAMTNRLHRNDLERPFSLPLDDEGSTVRERAPTSQPVSRKSDPNLSLDQRLESKLAEAASLLAKLEPQDARARLLHIAMLRRDESLLDGILAELALKARTARPSR